MMKQILAAVALASVWGAAAAEQTPLQLTVEARIPSDSFYVTPVGGWGGQVQSMNWQPGTQSLEPLRKTLEMKSSLGAIQGYLEEAAVLYSSNGQSNIALNVKVADKKLDIGSDKKVEVMSAVNAAASKRVTLEVEPVKPSGGYLAGQYSAVVNMMFESVAPPPPVK
nr:CS1 type fimbrial major subunit [Chromobacterium sp. ASV5]